MKNLLFFLLPLIMSAQTHRYIYEVHEKTDSLKDHYEKYNMALDINPKDTRYYPYAYIETDSLNKVRNQNSTRWDDLPAIIRQNNSHKNANYYLIDDGFYVVTTSDNIQWEIKPETKWKGEYQLQKAVTNFGGRNWIAWFNPNTPFKEGPYKFTGLPGMIFELKDDQDNFSFQLVKSQNLPKTYNSSDLIESFSGQKAIPISEKMYRKKLMEYYRAPLNSFKEEFKNNTNPNNSFYYNSRKIKSISEFRDYEKAEQEKIRSENNPIERDKAIDYSKK